MHFSGVKTIRATEEQLRKAAQRLQGRADVVAIYVFGSFVTRRKRPEDIDVCVIAKRPLGLAEELKIAAQFSDDVDLVFFYRLPVKVRFNVFREGRSLLVKDEETLAEVRARTIRQHQDAYYWTLRYERRWFE